MASVARVKEAVVVTPSEPTPSCVLSLSAVDSQLFLRFTIEYLLVYPPRQNTNQALTATRVKAALAKALVPYYPLSGRVRPKPDGSGLEVVCRAQGAVFIEAVSDRAISEFQHAPRYVTQWRKLLSLHVADVLKGAPPVVIQLTWLKDGGAAMGVGFNHSVCDGIGSAEFLNYFAELAAGKHGEFRPMPVWDRHLMDPTDVSPREQNHAALFDKVPDLCGVNVRERVKPSLPEGYYGNAFVLGCAQSSVKELTEKRLGFAAGLVRRAKERVGEEYVRGVVESVSGETKASPDSVGVLIVSQWSRLGLDRVDFGMGRPVHVGPICSDRYCLFLPVNNDDDDDDGGGQGESVKVMVAVPTSAVDKYELLVNSPYS
ncbi:hypothetical protein ACLB2K_076062 [Fragaria x ananassa]